MIPNKLISLADDKLSWLSSPRPGHLVQFYQSSDTLIGQLSEFVGSGLESGDSCIVIATPTHARRLGEQLQQQGLDIDSAQRDSQYKVLDATAILAEFMVNDLPDRNRFFEVIGTLVDSLVQRGKPIRACGEMVALLWKTGNKEAVIQLENLWNELAEIHDFSLFCAYPKLHFVMHKDMPEEIRKCHNVNLLGLATG